MIHTAQFGVTLRWLDLYRGRSPISFWLFLYIFVSELYERRGHF